MTKVEFWSYKTRHDSKKIEDWSSINLVVESRTIQINREFWSTRWSKKWSWVNHESKKLLDHGYTMCLIDQTDVLEASYFWKHGVLEARRIRRTTFLQHEVFCKTSYQRNFISKTSEAERELSRTGSKHDGIEAQWENPKLDETLISVLWKSSMKPKDRETFTAKVRLQIGFY